VLNDVSSQLDRAAERAAAAIAGADALLITAGAGIGVDSGLPDFRGNEGFWNAYPPMRKLGVSFVDMANPGWFQRDPELAWGFYGHRLNLYRETTPHAGFGILRRWGERMNRGSFVFTSNVDGQFQAAGFDPDRILECHGSIHHLQCTSPCGDAIWEAEGVEVSVDEATFHASLPHPACPYCGALARPNVLMFGDWSWIPTRSDAQGSRFNSWISKAAGDRLVVVEIGAGTAVPTVRMTSEQTVGRLGGTLIRINVREPQVPGNHIGLVLGGREALEQIDQKLNPI
jgi:NAD-dependent SIR2 family protein deacetylase